MKKTKGQKNQKTKRLKDKKKKRQQKMQKCEREKKLILWRRGSFTLLRCFLYNLLLSLLRLWNCSELINVLWWKNTISSFTNCFRLIICCSWLHSYSASYWYQTLKVWTFPFASICFKYLQKYKARMLISTQTTKTPRIILMPTNLMEQHKGKDTCCNLG